MSNKKIIEINRLLLKAIKRANKIYHSSDVRPFDILIYNNDDDDYNKIAGYNNLNISKLAIIVTPRIIKQIREYTNDKDEFYVMHGCKKPKSDWKIAIQKYTEFIQNHNVTRTTLKENPFENMSLSDIKKKMTKIYDIFNTNPEKFINVIHKSLICGKKSIIAIENSKLCINIVGIVLREIGVIDVDTIYEGLNVIKDIIDIPISTIDHVNNL